MDHSLREELQLKKKLLALLMGMSIVFSLAACGGGSDNSSSSTSGDSGSNTTEKNSSTSTASAEDLFKSKGCTACHGEKLEGGVGSDLRKIGASRTKDEIKEAILNGKTGQKGTMPAQNVTDEEADALAEWLAAKK